MFIRVLPVPSNRNMNSSSDSLLSLKVIEGNKLSTLKSVIVTVGELVRQGSDRTNHEEESCWGCGVIREL